MQIKQAYGERRRGEERENTQEENGWIRNHLHGEANSLPLPTAHPLARHGPPDERVAAGLQAQVLDEGLYTLLLLRFGEGRREL
jgi:hypothetical protein